jgi:hypothetical protein
MGEILTHYGSEIWSFILGLIGGGACGSLITFRITRHTRATDNATAVDQSRASAGGDLVGRDKITGSSPRR